MDFLAGDMGWVEVICGPMYSGKTEELIRRLRRAVIARKTVQVFKPLRDQRYGVDEIVSHSQQRLESTNVEKAEEILAQLNGRAEVVGIDEANFLGQELVAVVNRIADAGKRVIVAGLDTDYQGRPFAPIPDLLATAESITKTLAICVRCGNPAKQTQRIFASADLIVVGAAGMYEARCRACFEPGEDKQEWLALEPAAPESAAR
ncbi:MAG: thymidine kinase [Bryobacter sp.]